ncbi:MAG: hypothetical protein IPK64_00710 [bacterium]|nr:hypothetical protein [bacterium]
MNSPRTCAKALILLTLAAAPALALTVGQIDTFEDGTTAGWSVGNPSPVPTQNIASGGPLGLNDNYLQLRSIGGSGPGSRLMAFNRAQWAGDYVAAGAGVVALDVNNFGLTDLSLRLVFTDGANTAVTQVVNVPSASGWQDIQFAIEAADLIVLSGSAAAALAGTSEFRLMHNPLASFPPPPYAAMVGVDNLELRAGGASAVDDVTAVPRAASLEAIYPNPFNPRVAVRYALAQEGHVRVAVHDLKGNLITILEDGVVPAGARTVTWDGVDREGRRQASGAYVVELVAGAARERRVVTMIK